MKDDYDIEETLKQTDFGPRAEVKRSVMARFNQRMGGRDTGGLRANFWKRPIPLYAAAAAVLILTGLSFFAGQRSSRSGNRIEDRFEYPRGHEITSAQEITWTFTERDLF